MLPVEVHVLGVADGLFCFRVHIEQPFYLPSADDVFADYFFRIFGSDLRIEGIVGDNLNNRSFLAEAEASGGDYIYLVGNLVFLECLLKFFSDDMAGGCLASRAAANQNLQMFSACRQSAALFGHCFIALFAQQKCVFCPLLDCFQIMDS